MKLKFNKAIVLLIASITTPFLHAEITDPSHAFTVSAIKSIDEVEITITPEKDFFLYKDKISVYDSNSTSPMKINSVSGKAILKKFPQAPSHLIYESSVQIYVDRPKSQLLKVRYQGCYASGLCLPPQTKNIRVSND